MQLKQVQGTSKKTGKPYIAYYIAIGKYKTPLFFPSDIELMYIQSYLRKQAQKDFQDDGEDLGVEPLDED